MKEQQSLMHIKNGLLSAKYTLNTVLSFIRLKKIRREREREREREKRERERGVCVCVLESKI